MSDRTVSGDQPEPKKKGLSLSLFLGPTADVQTSIGKIYLYPMRVSDFSRFEKIVADEPMARFREVLPCVASLSTTSKIEKDREPLAPELVAQLSNADVELVAEAYAVSSALQTARSGSEDRSALPRVDGEVATSYVDRLLKKQLEDHANDMRQMRDKMLASTGGIFDQVRKSSALLGSTLTNFERLSRSISTPAAMPVFETKHLELTNHMAEQHARLARERAEELEMVRLTGQMTAQSAKTLQDLAEAASTLLENLNERDQRSDRVTRIQLWIAVGSVVVAAVLSGAAFFQDKANNITNDKWQGELLSSISEGNRQRSTAEEENKKLKAKVEELSDAVSRLLAAKVSQSTTEETKSSASAARRVTSPVRTLPAP